MDQMNLEANEAALIAEIRALREDQAHLAYLSERFDEFFASCRDCSGIVAKRDAIPSRSPGWFWLCRPCAESRQSGFALLERRF
jgi:hypothetical protein